MSQPWDPDGDQKQKTPDMFTNLPSARKTLLVLFFFFFFFFTLDVNLFYSAMRS